MITKLLSPLPAVIGLTVFGVGLLVGMWLLPKALLEPDTGRASPTSGEFGMRPARLGQRVHRGRGMGNLSRVRGLFSKPRSGDFVTLSSELLDEQLAEFITPDEVPDLLSALLEEVGVMGVVKWSNLYFITKGGQDFVILRDLVSYYYRSSPEEAIEWMKGLSTDHDRRLMARMLIYEVASEAPGGYYDKSQLKSLESLRPLASEFSASFDSWAKQSLMMYSSRGNTDGFVQILEFEAEFQLGSLGDDWTLPIAYHFNYPQAIHEFVRINETLSPDHRMTLPSDFHSQWEKSDGEGARAWRRENPDWNSQE